MKITSPKQFEILVAELEKNPGLAKGFSKSHVPANFKSDWEAIANKLNASGPPVRDTDGWQRVWKDLKFKTKKKLVHNKGEANSTGGGIYKQMTLSPVEEAVANLMQFQKFLNPQGLSLGGEDTVVENIDIDIIDFGSGNGRVETADDENEQIQNSVEAPRSSRIDTGKKRSGKDKTVEMLKEQYKLQQEHNEESRKIWTDIKYTLKESARFQRKRFMIEEERHKMFKEKYKQDEADRELGRKIKKRKLEVIDMQLAAYQ